jgi:hypothetical protein
MLECINKYKKQNIDKEEGQSHLWAGKGLPCSKEVEVKKLMLSW